MRKLFVVLLLLAAAVHPLAHFGDEAPTCPCVYGAVVQMAPPAITGTAAIAVAHLCGPARLAAAPPSTDVPARAPPAA